MRLHNLLKCGSFYMFEKNKMQHELVASMYHLTNILHFSTCNYMFFGKYVLLNNVHDVFRTKDDAINKKRAEKIVFQNF